MKKVGLALSGGGARGLIHIGAIKSLSSNNIPIDCIAGTSIGSFVGGLYAATKDVSILEEIALKNNWRDVFNLFFDPGFKGGILAGDKIINLIEKYAGNIEFKDLKIPFTAVATDFNTGKKVEIKSDKLSQATRASIAAPVFFQPVVIDNRILVDGGLISPHPVRSAKKMGADVVIGINLYKDYLSRLSHEKLGFIPVLRQTLKILLHNLSEIEAAEADIDIGPEVEEIGWNKIFSQKGSLEGILIGQRAADKEIPKIKKLLDNKKEGLIIKLIKLLAG